MEVHDFFGVITSFIYPCQWFVAVLVGIDIQAAVRVVAESDDTRRRFLMIFFYFNFSNYKNQLPQLAIGYG
ncbi:hypothetical protein BHC44_11950 [Snodgrassella alvi]|nr:hypothetical protein BHC44_11950 [Snodgrassella alvi]